MKTYSSQVKEKAKELILGGKTTREIGEILGGISIATISRWTRDVSKPDKYALLKSQAIELKLQGKSNKDVADAINIGETTANRWLKGMKPSMHPLYHISTIKHDYFSPENLIIYPERFVIIGFIAADGCICDTGAGQLRLQFNQSTKDKEVLEVINNEIANGERTISHNKSTNSETMYFPSDQICNDLAKYNIIPRKTAIMNLPNLEKENMKYFLRGYFYGDGCRHVDKKVRLIYHIVCTTIFANSLRTYLVENKVVDHCVLSILKNRENYAQVVFQGKHAKKFEEYILNDDKMVLLKRKHIAKFP